MNRLTPENWKDLTNDEVCGITHDCPYHNMTSVGGGGTECDSCALAFQLKKLAAYEDLGMDPNDAKLATCYQNAREQTNKILELTSNLTSTRKELKTYQNLLQQGRLQVAPCAIGRQVFVIIKERIEPTTVCGIKFTKDAIYIDTRFGDGWELGTDVFLTSPEAEAALNNTKEQQGRP